MAKIKNTEYFTFNMNIWDNKRSINVGHNRTLSIGTNEV